METCLYEILVDISQNNLEATPNSLYRAHFKSKIWDFLQIVNSILEFLDPDIRFVFDHLIKSLLLISLTPKLLSAFDLKLFQSLKSGETFCCLFCISWIFLLVIDCLKLSLCQPSRLLLIFDRLHFLSKLVLIQCLFLAANLLLNLLLLLIWRLDFLICLRLCCIRLLIKAGRVYHR